jgi:hypothetical protein
MNFYTVAESAAQLNETAFGYRISSQAQQSEKRIWSLHESR